MLYIQYLDIFWHSVVLQTLPVTEGDEEEEETTLETLLSRVGLQDKVSMFEEEQVDLDALVSPRWIILKKNNNKNVTAY